MAKTIPPHRRKAAQEEIPLRIQGQLSGCLHDKESHAIARCAFLEIITSRDRRVHELFEWNGVMATAREFALIGDRLAVRLGLQHRGELASKMVEATTGEQFLKTRLQSLSLGPSEQSSVIADLRTYGDGVHACIRRMVGLEDAAARLVRETWELPWPWLVVDLSNLFCNVVGAALCNRTVRIEFTLPPARIPEINFKPGPNEAPADSLKRLNRLLSPTFDRRGVRPRVATIARDIEWFYRARLKNPKDSIRAIAREYHATAHQVPKTDTADHRPTVRAGIERARHLLADIPGSLPFTSILGVMPDTIHLLETLPPPPLEKSAAV